MENRKTAETLQEKILYVIQSNYNEYTGTNEAELHSSVDLAHMMHTFAEQEAVEFAEWKDKNESVWYNSRRSTYYYNGVETTLPHLYQIFKAKRDGE